MAVLGPRRVGLVFICLASSVSASWECEDAGYTSELQCSTCEALVDFLGAESELCATCYRCCTSDDAPPPTHVSARIEVCK